VETAVARLDRESSGHMAEVLDLQRRVASLEDAALPPRTRHPKAVTSRWAR
jgi:hypothetical protein